MLQRAAVKDKINGANNTFLKYIIDYWNHTFCRKYDKKFIQ